MPLVRLEMQTLYEPEEPAAQQRQDVVFYLNLFTLAMRARCNCSAIRGLSLALKSESGDSRVWGRRHGSFGAGS
jgi:hypothetical protein